MEVEGEKGEKGGGEGGEGGGEKMFPFLKKCAM